MAAFYSDWAFLEAILEPPFAYEGNGPAGSGIFRPQRGEKGLSLAGSDFRNLIPISST